MRTGVLLLMLQASIAVMAQQTVDGIRIRPDPEKTRVVFDLSGPVEHKLFMLENPSRLVIDLNDTRMQRDELKAEIAELSLEATPIATLRFSPPSQENLRIVLDLKQEVKPRSFILKPIAQYRDRLVIDLFTEDQQVENLIQGAGSADRKPREIVIAIDPGHGGDDPGAIGPGNLYEKKVVLAISRELKTIADRTYGYKGVLTRQGDYYVARRKRTAIARENQSDVFVSIHADGWKTSSANGASVYAISESGATSEMAKWLAEKENRADLIGGVGSVSLDDKDDMLAGVLLDLSQTASLSASLEMGEAILLGIKPINRLHKKNVEQAAFLVLKSPDIPSLLVETGFITNPGEARKLASRKHQKKLAAGIFAGINQYFSRTPPNGTLLAAGQDATTGETITHVIRRGDTLSEIALRYNISFEDLKRANTLKSNTIRIGQTLRIPQL
ncbi:MAG: N-acetylmuramoyl-L-alanine amidase [Gammaproteobacteria bacterium]|nr:N-acetylmuramoyl-L-alanine amidase [Gammaproteobacteria bacterium]